MRLGIFGYKPIDTLVLGVPLAKVNVGLKR